MCSRATAQPAAVAPQVASFPLALVAGGVLLVEPWFSVESYWTGTITGTIVGVVADVYHIWWDPELYTQIERAAGRIEGFHIDDWPVPNKDPLMSRAMMGDGAIELRRIRSAIDPSSSFS